MLPRHERAPRRAPGLLAASMATAVLVACAGGPAPAPRPVAAAEALVEVLPAGAALEVDGVTVGRGGRVIALPDVRRTYRLRASAPGFEPAERADPGAQLAGARVALALRPVGSPGSGPLDADDGEALAVAAETLVRAGQRAAALEYATRAATISPNAARVRRLLEELRDGPPEQTIEVRSAAPRSQR
jgi:hypothetical protein